MCHLLVCLHPEFQVGDVDARHGVFRLTTGDDSHDTVFRQVLQTDVHISIHIEVSYVEESPLWLSGVFTWLVVIGHPVKTFNAQLHIVFLVQNVQCSDAQLVIDRSLLGLLYPE